MDLYHVLLFVHIVGAIVLVGGSLVSPALGAAMRRAATVDALRGWVGHALMIGRASGPAAVAVLVSGLYMTWAQWSFSQAWVVVSLTLFAVAGGIANAGLEPRLKKVMAAAEHEPDGPVSAELRAVATQPALHTLESVLLGVDLAIVFLMTNKPGLVGSLLVVVGGLAISGVLVMRAARHRRQPAPAVAA